jgi:hypothetical protein
MVHTTSAQLEAQLQELREAYEESRNQIEANSQATSILQEIQEGNENTIEEAQEERELTSIEQTQVRNKKIPKVPNNLPKFTGKEGESVRNWILRLENACQVGGHTITDTSTILPSIAGTTMEAPADGFFLQWSSTTPVVKRTWKNFKENVRNHFEGSNFQNTLRKRLQDLNQKSSIEEYNNDYFHIIQQVENMSEVD